MSGWAILVISLHLTKLVVISRTCWRTAVRIQDIIQYCCSEARVCLQKEKSVMYSSFQRLLLKRRGGGAFHRPDDERRVIPPQVHHSCPCAFIPNDCRNHHSYHKWIETALPSIHHNRSFIRLETARCRLHTLTHTTKCCPSNDWQTRLACVLTQFRRLQKLCYGRRNAIPAE